MNDYNNYPCTDIKLLPCPFCGGIPEKTFIGNEHSKKRSMEIRCPDCRIERVTGAIRMSSDWLNEMAIKEWNQRAPKLRKGNNNG